jgi:hypothetical protein
MLRAGHGAGFTVIENAFSSLCVLGEQLSSATIVKPKEPVVVGTPEIIPVGLTLNPGGRVPVPSLKVIGGTPPDACIWVL